MTDAEIFDSEMRLRGGRLPREVLPLESIRVYELIESQARTLIDSARSVLQKLPPIHFDFIHNERINACAFKTKEGKYFIGLNTGSIYMLNFIFMRMLADSRLFREFGEAEKERSDLPVVSNYVPYAEQMHLNGNVLVQPTTHTRRDYALFLQEQALMFLIGHEIAHISLGHVGYLASKRSLPFLTELDWNAPSSEEQLERHCIEFAADRRSVWSRVHSLRQTYEMPEYQALPWAISPERKDIIIYHWSVAVNVLFSLFESSRFNPYENLTASYPPLALRQMVVEAFTAEAVTEGWDPSLQERARQAYRAAIKHVDAAFVLITDGESSVSGSSQVLDEKQLEHIKKLNDYGANVLKDRVMPFSFE